ncbi:cytochrome c oxidase assembly factor 8 [Fundulus heteroclitus]|uniref:cytochrome c oxidase assembly factor 8 n=1 Tax=Fundulus heteroclitus TaxID=8078 RepID=UPI00165CA705|nr:cytochrome c oxidase assembly factor 8 [Fundulus heteroclitus]
MATKAAAAWRSVSGAALRPHRISAASRRLCSSEPATRQNPPTKASTLRPEPSPTHDWIGPPNPLSNLRPIVYRINEKESDLEKQLRKLRQETEDWNHSFWAKQNVSFSKEKEAFIISQLKAKGLTLRGEDGRRRTLSSEEMAIFYKSFLDRNQMRHADYNKEWYRRNFTITMLMAKVALDSLWKTVTEKQRQKKNSTPTN